jgi:hypothetical protein
LDFDVKAVAACFAIVVAMTTIYRFFKKAPSEKDEKQEEAGTKTVASRFTALFESHGVQRSQIPAFFGHDLSIHNCSTDDELLVHITEEMLVDAAKLFGINLDWLHGASNEIYDIPDFYKQPKAFIDYLAEVFGEKPIKLFDAYVLTAGEINKKRDENDGLIVIVETIGEVNNRSVFRYHLSGQWLLVYWKSRADFTACCSVLMKSGVHPIGNRVDASWLTEVINGSRLLSYDFQCREGGIDLPSIGYWAVDEFIELPQKYLDGVDTEIDNFGRKAALGRWLSLKEHMNCYNDDNQQVVTLYESELEKLK